MNTFESMKERCIQDAQEEIKEKGGIRPRVYVITTDRKFFYFDYCIPPDKKGEFQNMVVGLIRYMRLAGVFATCGSLGEAWYATRDKDSPDVGLRPTLDPDRKEGVFVFCRDEKEKYMHFWDIDRSDAKNPKLDDSKFQECGDFISWLDEAFIPLPEEIPDEVRRIAADTLRRLPEILGGQKTLPTN